MSGTSKTQTRTYYDPDDTEAGPKFTAKGIRPSKVIERARRVVAKAIKVLDLPFDEDDRSRLPPMRRYIARMGLTPAQLARLIRVLHSEGVLWALPGRPTPTLSDHCERYGCNYGTCSLAAFYAYRAALSLLVETPPRSRLDLDDLLEILMARPGALPPELQASVASVIGAHMADAITGRPFKCRPLVARGGARKTVRPTTRRWLPASRETWCRRRPCVRNRTLPSAGRSEWA